MSVPDPAKPWVPLWDTGSGGSAKPAAIPGELKLWGGKVLPALDEYGVWVWADGADYAAATYPKAAANIAPEWKTHDGKADPGAGRFRVPDLRGLVPAGLDAMPGGARANRVTRSVAIAVAGKSGIEYHTLELAEAPAHSHVVNGHTHGGTTGYQSHDHGHGIGDPTHGHTEWWAVAEDPKEAFVGPGYHGRNYGLMGANNIYPAYTGIWTGGVNTNHYHGVNSDSPGTDSRGSGGAHETMQPTVFVPYIVALDS